MEHFDILHRLWTHRSGVRASVVKVKAHLDIPSISEPLSRYLAMGNKFADTQANIAVSRLMPDVVQELENMHAEIVSDQQLLQSICELHVDLSQVRVKAESQEHRNGHNTQSFSKQEIFNAFATWAVAIPIPLFGHIHTKWCGGSAWGEYHVQGCSMVASTSLAC